MRKHIIIYLAVIGFIGFLASCEKDENKITMLSNPVAPSLNALPNLALQRAHGTDILEFTGTPVNPGFTASTNYYLEACAKGNNFKDSILIMSGIQDSSMKITVSDLNGILLKKYPADQISSLDFRIRASLVIDAGTGAKPMNYISDSRSADVSVYGLPRLDLLVNSTVAGKVESALGDGNYIGYVKLDKTKPFTLKDPDANVIYGDNSGALKINGTGITSPDNGYYQIIVNTKNLSYTLSAYNVGVVGDFTGWGSSSPDRFMEYDAQKYYWYITLDLPVGPMKFRLNSAWSVNWGPDNAGGDANLPANGGSLSLPDTKGNIVITAAGNYTITFSPNGSTGTCTFVKNN